MKNALKLILTAFLVVLFFSGTSFATTIGLIPVSTSIEVGGSVNVDIVISELETIDVGAFDIDVTYDDSIISFNN